MNNVLRRGHFSSIIILFLGSFLIFSYFALNTESRYAYFPLGDAKTYTLMAIHYNNPATIKEPLPTIYTTRMLPSMVVGFLSSWQLKNEDIDKISYFSDLDSPENFDVNYVISRNFRILNFFMNFFTVYFLYLIFCHLKFSKALCISLALSFMTFFIPVRLYVCWSQMTDPAGFMFIAAMFYCILKNRPWMFIVLSALCVFVRENTLFLLPCFWLYLFSFRSPPIRKILFFIMSFTPIILFFYLRAHTYFPSTITVPYSQFIISYRSSLTAPFNLLVDYFYLLFYHLRMLSIYSLGLNIISMPFYNFGILAFLLLLEHKETVSLCKKYYYFLPYILFSFLIGINIDRQFFYLFPVIFIMAGHIINRHLAAKGNLIIFFLAIIFWLNFYLYGHFIPVAQENILFIDKHQLEYILTKGELWRMVVRLIMVGIAGIFSYTFIQKWNKKIGIPEASMGQKR